MLNLINDVLDLAKIESGKTEVLIEKFFVGDILKRCLNSLTPLFYNYQLKIINNVGDSDYLVLADSTCIKQVLLNILSNATKYNRVRGTITIDCKVVNEGFLRISITDTGKGIIKEDMSKLFTSFERLNVLDEIEGTGIGLAISKKLVELMNGNIGVESTPGKGSTSWVELKIENQCEKTSA